LLNYLSRGWTSEKPSGKPKTEELRRLHCLHSDSLRGEGWWRGRRKLVTCTSCNSSM